MILAACAAVFVAAWQVTDSLGFTMASLGCLVAFWFAGIEVGLLPMWIEHVAARRARKRGGPVESIWFVDLDRRQDKELARMHDRTEDNPTIR